MNTPQLQSQTLQEISTSLGTCFGVVDNHEYAFLVLASETYPRATLRGILCELKEGFYKNNPNAAEVLLDSHTVSSEYLVNLGKKYSRAQGTPKVTQAQEKIMEVQLQMHENIKKALENQENMNVIRDYNNVGNRVENSRDDRSIKTISEQFKGFRYRNEKKE